MLKFGIHMLGSYLIGYLSFNIDKGLIGKKYGATQLGFYNRAYHLSAVPTTQLSNSLFHVAVATLSKLRDEPEKFRHYFLSAISTISFIGFPISAFMVIMSKEIVYFLLGPQWNQAAILFSVLGLTSGITLIYATHGWLHVSLGRADRWMKWGIFSSFLMVVGFVVGISFGAVGVAVAYSMITTLITLPGIVYAGSPIGMKLRDVLGTIWKHFCAASLAGAVCFCISRYGSFVRGVFINLLINLVLFTVIYVICTVILYRGLQPIRKLVSLLKMLLGISTTRIESTPSSEGQDR
jgi:PST family polysaccharide transporter